MKILHVQAQLPARTGSGVYYSNVIEGFDQDENACVYGCYPGFKYSIVDSQHQYPVVFPNDQCQFPLPGMSDVMPYQSTVYGKMTPAMIEAWWQIFKQTVRRAIAEFKPDVIFCHHLWFLTALVCQEAPKDIPIYVFCHGTDLRQAHQHPALCQKYVTNLSRLTAVFALSHPQVQDIQTVYGIPADKIKVVGGGYDPAIFSPHPAEDHRPEVRLVYAGKLSAAKGTFALAEAFQRLSKVNDHVTLKLVGSASPAVKQRLAPYLQNPRLQLCNVQSQRHLAQVYWQSDIFVLPSYYEGLGLGAIEALACDLRVVVTDIAALKEQLGPIVNNSGVISYVQRPRRKNEDEPLAADLPAFYDRLVAALTKQVAAVENGDQFSAQVKAEILKNSWPHLIQKIKMTLPQNSHD